MFLLSEYLLGQGENGGLQFTSNTQETNVRYKGSMAQTWCRTATNPDSSYEAFTAGELSAMLDTTKSDPEYAGKNWRNKVYAAAENILENDKVFFLSAEEAANAAYGFEEEGKLIAYYNNAATEMLQPNGGCGLPLQIPIQRLSVQLPTAETTVGSYARNWRQDMRLLVPRST